MFLDRPGVMRGTQLVGTAALALILIGCAAVPTPDFVAPQASPLLGGPSGPMLAVDACIQRRVLVGVNYFVVAPSTGVARTLQMEVRAHLARRGVTVAPMELDTACGVLFDASNPMKNRAEAIDAPISVAAQPLRRSTDLVALSGDATSWSAMLSEVQAMALASQTAQPAAGAQTEQGRAASTLRLSNDARHLANVATRGQGRKTLLFIGLSGNSESAGKMAAQATALAVLSLAAGIAAGGPVVVGGAQSASFGVAQSLTSAAGASFLAQDGWQLVGALVDVETGELRWANVVKGASDPLGADALNRAVTTDRLLRMLLNRPAAQWSVPGQAP